MRHFNRVFLAWLTLLCLATSGWAHGNGEGPSKEVMKRIFPGAESFVTRPLAIKPAVQNQLEKRIGKPLEAHDLKSNVYIATAKGQSLGVLWATDAHLKEGPVDVIVGLDRQGRIAGVALDHSPLASLAQSSYLNQYKGKTAASPLQQGKDLKPLSSNPTASQLVAQAARKAAILIDIVYLGGKK